MISLLRQRNYGLLWVSQLVSQTGNWALFAALPFFVFQVTGSVLATGTMFAVEVIPAIVIGSLAGVFVDRWDRRWTMIGANVARGALLLLLIFFRSPEQVWLVYIVAFVSSVANLFFNPANNALLPLLVSKQELVTANSLDALGENAARIIGPAIGGAALAYVGLTAVALIDMATYFIGAGLIFLIQVPGDGQAASDRNAAGQGLTAQWLAFWKEWVSGLRLAIGYRPLAYVFLAAGVALIGDSILSVLLVVFVQGSVGGGAQEFGWILTARGVGGILGGLAVARFGPRFRPKNLIAFGMAGVGALLLLALWYPKLWFVLLISVLFGLPTMAWLIAGQTWLQTNTTDEYRGRLFGAFETYAAFMGLLGIGFASLAGDALGVHTSLAVAAALFIGAGLLAFVLLQPRFLEEAAASEIE
ncbi:MAG: MFS transporter [Candidatus Promineifilaceae bacterium]